MNKTGNKQLVFEPFIKREKNGSKSIEKRQLKKTKCGR